MGKMKIIRTLVFFLLSVFHCAALIKDKNSHELSECKKLAYNYQMFRDTGAGGSLPRSWADFETVRSMRKGDRQSDVNRMRLINSFAMVPGAPVIINGLGIPMDFQGCSLLLISREEKYEDDYESAGRYAILVGSEVPGTDIKPLLSYFLTSKASRAILEQIPDFDPIAQPLAFEPEFIAKVEREQKAHDAQSEEEIRDYYRDKAAREEKDHSPLSVFAVDGKIRWMPVAVTFLLLSLIVFLLVIGVRRKFGK